MRIHIVGVDLPGRSCPGPRGEPGHDNIHVAVQRRAKPAELLDPVPADAAEARWTLDCAVTETPAGADLRGPYLQGGPGARFVYLSWGTVGADGTFAMFRRAKLWLDGVPGDVLTAAIRTGQLVGRLGLTDRMGQPTCAAVRPPLITWSAGPAVPAGDCE